MEGMELGKAHARGVCVQGLVRVESDCVSGVIDLSSGFDQDKFRLRSECGLGLGFDQCARRRRSGHGQRAGWVCPGASRVRVGSAQIAFRCESLGARRIRSACVQCSVAHNNA